VRSAFLPSVPEYQRYGLYSRSFGDGGAPLGGAAGPSGGDSGVSCLCAGEAPSVDGRGRFGPGSRFTAGEGRAGAGLLFGSFTAMASPLVTSKLGGVLGSQPGPKLSALKR
jgi:hypothetical protein